MPNPSLHHTDVQKSTASLNTWSPSSTVITAQPTTPKMKPILLFSLLTASSHAQFHVPTNGCEWVQLTTPITNFTYTNTTNSSTPDSVHWTSPAWSITCNASRPGLEIGVPRVNTNTDCGHGQIGRFLVIPDEAGGRIARLRFMTSVLCAASMYHVYYQGRFLMDCVEGVDGSETCGPKGEATASVYDTVHWLPSDRLPLPPCCDVYWGDV